MTTYGQSIRCNRIRPTWLSGEVWLRTIYEGNTMRISANHAPWHGMDIFQLPADHPAYLAINEGFTPWAGGDTPPVDWDGGPVLLRNGNSYRDTTDIYTWNHRDIPPQEQIIGYRTATSYIATSTTKTAHTAQVTNVTYDYAVRLLQTLHAKHWPERPSLTIGATTLDVLSQIDNLTTALVRQEVADGACEATVRRCIEALDGLTPRAPAGLYYNEGFKSANNAAIDALTAMLPTPQPLSERATTGVIASPDGNVVVDPELWSEITKALLEAEGR